MYPPTHFLRVSSPSFKHTHRHTNRHSHTHAHTHRHTHTHTHTYIKFQSTSPASQRYKSVQRRKQHLIDADTRSKEKKKKVRVSSSSSSSSINYRRDDDNDDDGDSNNTSPSTGSGNDVITDALIVMTMTTMIIWVQKALTMFVCLLVLGSKMKKYLILVTLVIVLTAYKDNDNLLSNFYMRFDRN